MYRNVVYNSREKNVKLFTWNKEGERISIDVPFKPYLYVETSRENYDATSIFNTHLKKIQFDNEFERRKYVKETSFTRLYYNIPVEQQFLIDTFGKHNKKQDFSKYTLKYYSIDIEVYSPDEFPDEWEAKHPINVISVYDNIRNEFFVWGVGQFDPNRLNKDNKEKYDSLNSERKINYFECNNEKEVLEKFIEHWSNDYPDIITGWNISFDIPYIYNRIVKLLSEKLAKSLSPVNQVYRKNRKKKIHAQHEIHVEDYVIKGVSTLDYQDVYIKFNINPVPNHKLDTIANIEIGQEKINYESSNLAKLADEDWNTFVFYNIQDVNIIIGLENKLKYMQVTRMLAYMGLVNLEQGLYTVSIVNGYAAINAAESDQIIPTFTEKNDWRNYEGGFVKEPKSGIYKHIISFDLNSLYPNTMITLNMSPETKFGKIIEKTDNYVILETVNLKRYKIEIDKFDDFIRKNNIAISKSNVLFRQDKKGIFSKMVEEVYNGRVADKTKMKKNKILLQENDNIENKSNLELEIEQLDILQYAKKIFINSVYGYCGNRYAAMSDIDIAESVTLTCQDVIKQSGDILNSIVSKILGKEIDVVCYNDTDSAYITISSLVEKYQVEFLNEDGKVNDYYKKITSVIEDKLNEKIKEWGTTELYSNDCRFEFKSETICDAGFFLKKKHYMLHVLNDEGFDTCKWKYKGIRVVSASLPDAIKPLIKNVVEELVIKNDEDYVNSLYLSAYDKFNSLDVDDIVIIKAVNKYSEYANDCSEFKTASRMQAHYRGAYYYNLLLDKLNLSHKYEKIKNSDKVKCLYLQKNNKYGIDVISYVNDFPKEFIDLFNIDRKLMFEKNVKDVLESFYKAVNWNIKSPNLQPKANIMKLFSL